MNLENHCFNATPPGQRDAVSCVTLSMALAAIEQAKREEREAIKRLICKTLQMSDPSGMLCAVIDNAAIRARKP